MTRRVLLGVSALAGLVACGSPCRPPGPSIVYVQGGIPPGTFDGGADGGPSTPSAAWCQSVCPDAGVQNACFEEPNAGTTAIQCAPIGAHC